MKRSIKSKLVWAFTGIVTIALLVSGSILIWQNVQQMRQEIYLNALTFAELTHDEIITSFEQFYETENFLQFRKDLNPLVAKSVDISQIEIIGKSGELFYNSSSEADTAYLGEPRVHIYNLEPSRNIRPSLTFRNGETVYVTRGQDEQWVPVTATDEVTSFPSGEVLNILFPHENSRLSVVYTLSYDALISRILQTVLGIVAVLSLSVLVVVLAALSIAGRLVRPIKTLESGVLQIAEGKYGTQVSVTSQDEIGVLADNFNLMSTRLKKDTEELLIKEALQKELNIAAEIQQNMLPSTDPKLKNLDISGSLTPATTIGGDIYDYLQVDKTTYVFIADVTGHGVPAGMVANVTLSTLYSYSKVYSEPAEILKAMNWVVYAKTKPNMFATALLAKWQEGSRKLSFSNAGHEEIIHYQADKKDVQLIGKGGMALGMSEVAGKLYIPQEVEIKKDDVLVFYTDGIPEAWKNEKENLGIETLLDIVKGVASRAQDAKSIREGILKSVDEFRAGYPQQDDITIIVIKGV
ncbi:MAG: SpoIIE family protein phosphatase [bacterium]|nr:SpoIIE family protein phosphatase [bacterium]